MMSLDTHPGKYLFLAGPAIGLSINCHQALVTDAHHAQGRAWCPADRALTGCARTLPQQRGSNGIICRNTKFLAIDQDRNQLPGWNGVTEHSVASLRAIKRSKANLLHDIRMFEDHALLQVKLLPDPLFLCPIAHSQTDRNIDIGEADRVEINSLIG